MADENSPAVRLLLVPNANDAGEITGLQYIIEIRSWKFKSGDVFCSFGQETTAFRNLSAALPNLENDNPVMLQDGDGLVRHSYAASEKSLQVCLAREPRGLITLRSRQWEAASENSPSGYVSDASELGPDQGGLIWVGRLFLPRFSLGTQCLVSIEWDLGNCSEGTRAVCSFGEGPGPVEILGDAETILDCVFMVGPVRSHPPDRSSSGLGSGKEGFCGTYWFGDLPKNLDAVKDYGTEIFPRMAEHFNDENGNYRAFIRRVPKRLRSSAFQSSGVIDYSTDTKDEHDWDLVRLLNWTMVSTWAQLDAEGNGTENDWFTQGLSLLYTVFLPFRFGQRGPDYFRATVNAFLSAYFTNPLVAKPLADLQCMSLDQSWYVGFAKAARAFVYMLKMDAFTRRASVARDAGVLRPMDDIVRDLCSRRRKGEQVQKKDWLERLAGWIGQEDAERHFQEMVEDGMVNELDDMLSSFGETYGPQPVEQEVMDFGFDKESLNVGIVIGVVPSSRAWEAGLRDGDKVVWHPRLEACELDIKKTFKLTVERNGEKVNIEYWPRSRKKVRCWQVLERNKTRA